MILLTKDSRFFSHIILTIDLKTSSSNNCFSLTTLNNFHQKDRAFELNFSFPPQFNGYLKIFNYKYKILST